MHQESYSLVGRDVGSAGIFVPEVLVKASVRTSTPARQEAMDRLGSAETVMDLCRRCVLGANLSRSLMLNGRGPRIASPAPRSVPP